MSQLKSIGGALIGLGLISFILNMFDMELRILNFTGDPDTSMMIKVGMIGVGVLLLVIGFVMDKKKEG